MFSQMCGNHGNAFHVFAPFCTIVSIALKISTNLGYIGSTRGYRLRGIKINTMVSEYQNSSVYFDVISKSDLKW